MPGETIEVVPALPKNKVDQPSADPNIIDRIILKGTTEALTEVRAGFVRFSLLRSRCATME